MARIILSKLAVSDLEDIWNYISEYNPDAANAMLRGLAKTFRLLSENAEIGRNRPELFVNLRSLPHKNYVIFYFPSEDGVEIYRVLHGSRDIEEVFEDTVSGSPGLDEE